MATWTTSSQRPPRLPAPIPENQRVDAGTSTSGGGGGGDGVMQNRLEEAKTPTDSTGSASSESWFASLFRSASLR